MATNLEFRFKNNKSESSNIVLKIDGENCHKQKTIANYFNDFFTTIAANLVQKLPLGKNVYDINSTSLKDYYCKNKSERETFFKACN